MMTALLILAVVVLFIFDIVLFHRRCRAVEESEIVLDCHCGKPLKFVRFADGSAVRRCSEGHTDIRLSADTCPDPSCRGHLTYNGERPRDYETCIRDKVCTTCGHAVELILQLTPRCKKVLASLESGTNPYRQKEGILEKLEFLGIMLLLCTVGCCVCAYQVFMRLMHGACPTRCGGWKVHHGRYAVDGGVEDVYGCSNEYNWLTDDVGCPWNEHVFTSFAGLEAEVYLLQQHRLGNFS
ncbi:MAG: hypothetical protein V1907_03720 [Candidatus Kerfeldbacteria bacterium]